MITYLVQSGRIAALAELVAGWRAVLLDCETTGLNAYLGDRLLGFALADLYAEEPTYYYVSIGHSDADNVAPQEAQALRAVLEGKPLLGFNIKFDLHHLARLLGDFSRQPLYDVLVAARLMAMEEKPILDLDALAARELSYQYRSEAAGHEREFGKGKFTVHQIGNKCCEDVHCTRLLYLHYKERMPPRLKRLFLRECELTASLYRMEARGIRFEPDAVLELDSRFTELREAIRAQLTASTGRADFNPNSYPQVAALMDSKGISSWRLTPTGNPSWQREVLEEIDDPDALLISQDRALGHEQTNLLACLKRYLDKGLDVLHGTYRNWGTVTGRLSSSNPNLQGWAKGWLQLGQRGEYNEPLRWSEDGPNRSISLRGLFRPREGYQFLAVDYRQIEMFMAGYWMQDSQFLKLLEEEDFHAATAMWVWGQAGPEYRKRAKWFNFGLLYGLGEAELARRLGCGQRRAGVYRAEYFSKIPGYQRVLRVVAQHLERDRFVENVYGRRYWLSPQLAHIAFNYLCQGSAGDYVKFRLPLAERLLDGYGGWPLLITHDEIVFEVPVGGLGFLSELVPLLEEGSPFGMRLPVALKASASNLVDLEAISAKA